MSYNKFLALTRAFSNFRTTSSGNNIAIKLSEEGHYYKLAAHFPISTEQLLKDKCMDLDNPLENRVVQIQAPVFHCYKEHRNKKATSPFSIFTWLKQRWTGARLKTSGTNIRSKWINLARTGKINQSAGQKPGMVQRMLQAVSGCISPPMAFQTLFWSGKTRQALGSVMCYYLQWSASQFQSLRLIQSDMLGDQSGKEM